MRKQSRRNGRRSSWLYLIYMALADLFLLTSAAALLMAAASIPLINPPPKDLAEKHKPKKPVTLWGFLEWEYGSPNDADLWGECITLADGLRTRVIVSYKQKTDGWLDLSQDDLGRPSPENFETLQSNSNASEIPPRTVCTFNVHHYSAKGGPMPLRGTFKLWWRLNTQNEVQLADLNFTIDGGGAERTLLTMHWDDRGQLDRDTIELYPIARTRLLATTPPSGESHGHTP